MKKITDEYEIEITTEDIIDLLCTLRIEYDGIELDKVYDIAPSKGKKGHYYDVIMGNSKISGKGVIYFVGVSPETFYIYGKDNTEDHIDLSSMWRQLLLNKKGKEYAEYFIYNWEEIEAEYSESIAIAEDYLKRVKAIYDDVLKTYEDAMATLNNTNNNKR